MTTIQSKNALISQIYLKLNKMKWIVHDFWLSFTINNEQIEPNLNGVLANKYDTYDVDQEILIIFEKFWIVRSHF